MRNLAQYPITSEEIIETVEGFRKSVDFKETGLYGDIRPICLDILLKFVLNYRDELDLEVSLAEGE